MIQPGRKYSATDGYRCGFNGKENDNDVKGEGNQQDYGMRIYDPRLGRFLSVDPITKEYPELTPYQFASNTPIVGIDLDGLELFGVNGFDIWFFFKYGLNASVKELGDNTTGKIIRGSTKLARVENKDMSYQQPPETPEGKLPGNLVRKLEFDDKVDAYKNMVEGTANTIEFSTETLSYFLPVEAGFELAGRGLWSLLKASPKAKGLITKFAEKLIANTTKKELPRAITAIVNTRTGSIYYGKSGALKSIDEIHPDLKQLIPKESLEKWPTINCSEVDALNQALKNGADVKDLEMHTLKIDAKTGDFTNFERCENCKVTTKDIKTTSDKKNVKPTTKKKG